jgi:S1-C subfamily serine protease
VQLRAEVPDDAFTAGVLGTERLGHGVVIRGEERAAVLTIGYLIAEASSIWLTTHSGRVVPGHPLAYDYVTGFGLVLPLGDLDAGPLERGSAAALEPGDELSALGHGGTAHSLATKLVAKREFAGYWEYLLDEALFTAPAHPRWSGSALVDHAGRLVGIGSLLVQESVAGESFDANMYLPIDALEPILGKLVQYGQSMRPARPWLGLYSTERNGRVIVAGLIADGPAHRAGVSLGDEVMEVAGEPVSSLAEFYRALWRSGPAGVKIPLTLLRDREPVSLAVHSASRDQYLKQPQRH